MLTRNRKKEETQDLIVIHDDFSRHKNEAHKQLVKAKDVMPKRKMGEQNQEIETLKKKLKESESCAKEHKHKLELLKVKHELFVQNLKEQVKCPVCLDVPRSGPVLTCPNGHFLCSNCKAKWTRDECPSCRTLMGNGKSLLAVAILHTVDHKCKFNACKELFSLGNDLLNHETACPHRTVRINCGHKVSLSGLFSHLLDTSCGSLSRAPPLKALHEWSMISHCYTHTDMERMDAYWAIYPIFVGGRKFGFFPTKVKGTYYFVLFMFATEAECLKYHVEIIVQGNVLESVDAQATSTKFVGTPFSVDTPKEDMKVYAINSQLMKKIINTSESKKSFRVFFKVSKVC